VAEGARLESVYTLIAYRGFESLSLRQQIKTAGSLKPAFLCLKPAISGASGRFKRTGPFSFHPDICPLWHSLWSIFSAVAAL
jgi:hypothetical protein